ncbi:hypothetical protein KA183_20345 [bacterium]|nr:hypothetical protein [bacterium]QQR56394.1 MAG: hypothetical protein IPG59_15450 [Candidatus Melainabacteria bacterium]
MRLAFTATILSVVLCSFANSAQAQPTVNYDLTTFKEKPKTQSAIDFSLKADDFGKHSYKRALLKSKFSTSSVGLGVNGQNPAFNSNAFDYLHPETLKDNLENVSDDDAYFDEAYNKPEVQKNYSSSYEINKRFDDKFNKSDSKFQSKKDDELFGTHAGFNRQNSQQGNPEPSKKFQLNKDPNPDDSMF